MPTVNEFLDIVLSRTQRKLPTQIRSGFKISRIRAFYTRKVRFTSETFKEKLGAILTEFPNLSDLHPFHADLLNILYDRDHLKIALGQLSTAKHLIEGISRDYVRLMKYGDSLYRCKQLKIAALGRMATIMKKQKSALEFLEQVRQHMARLPAIDPNTRTLLVCGYPNVGKSSFMNKVTRAQVDVQPYAFTTKSLFVGHMDYKYLRWQVIDTPGILDHPLEEMNTIEMQSITAMAHLRSAVLYFMDLSEECGFSIEAQVNLFNSIKPLFANKITYLVVNKIDKMRPEDLDEKNSELLQSILKSGEVKMLQTSCLTEDGVMNVRNSACDALLASRVEAKLKTNKAKDILNRIHLAQPEKRDEVERPPFFPEQLRNRVKYDKDDPNRRRIERDLQEEQGGAGVYDVDIQKKYILEDDSWKYDKVPEFYNGKNVADFIDPEIDQKLIELEAEEEQLQKEGFYDSDEEVLDDEQLDTLAEASDIKKRAYLKALEKRKKLALNNRANIPRQMRPKKLTDVQASLRRGGLDDKRIAARAKHQAIVSRQVSEDAMDVDARGPSRSRSKSNRREDGIQDEASRIKAERILRMKQRERNRLAKASESDRKIQTKMPKHLFSGKRRGFHTSRSR